MMCIYIYIYLVGGIATPLQHMKVDWDNDIPDIWKHKTCSKPPTEHCHIYLTSSTAQGGGGSFKDRKPLGEVACCDARMAEQSH